jgi:anti-anti-sigma factor
MKALGRSREVPPLAIEVRQLGAVSVAFLCGDLLFGPAADLLRSRVEGLLDAGCTTLILDLHHLSRLDSVGVGTLIDVANLARREGAWLHLLEPSAPARAVLTLLNLHRRPDLLPILTDSDRSLAGLAGAPIPA